METLGLNVTDLVILFVIGTKTVCRIWNRIPL